MRHFPHQAREGPAHASSAERAIVFAAAAAFPVYLGIRGGGYDIVVREQAGLVLWWVLAVAYLFGFLPRGRPARAARLPLIAFTGLVAWTALSLIWTESREQTFAEFARTLDFAGLIVLVLSGVSRSTWRAAAAGLSTGVVALVLVSVASRIDPGPFPADAVAQAFHGDRLSWPLGYWNAVGAWGAMAIAMGLAWSAGVRTRWVRGLSLASVPVAATAVYLSYSRAGAAGSVLAVLLVVGLSRHRRTALVHALVAGVTSGLVVLAVRSQPAIADGTGGDGGLVVGLALAAAAAGCAWTARETARRGLDAFRGDRWVAPVLVAGACALAIGAVVIGPSAASRATSEFTSGARPGERSDPAARFISLGGSRYQIWSSALGAFESDPLKGIGPGTFRFWWVRDVPGGERLLDAHSLPLETLAELGLPGFALLVTALGGLLALALRGRALCRGPTEIAAAAAMVAGFGVWVLAASVDWMWEMTAVTVVGIGAAAIAGAAASVPASGSRRPTRGRLAIALLAVLAGIVQIPGIVSTDRTRAGLQALALGFEPRAADLADDAVAGEPWAASPYALRSLVELQRGQLEQAQADARTAIDHEPTNPAYRRLLVVIQGKAGGAEPEP